MREIDVDAKVLAHVDRFEAAAHAFEAGKARAHRFQGYAHREAYAGRAERVVDVEAGGHVERHISFSERGLHAEARTRASDVELEWMEVGRRGQSIGTPEWARTRRGGV